VDIMPTDGEFLGLNTAWFKEALATATAREFAHTSLKLVSPVGFLATKYVAFLDRGTGDYYASHDLKDLESDT
jgi:predicted nucleotidyltransferase